MLELGAGRQGEEAGWGGMDGVVLMCKVKIETFQKDGRHLPGLMTRPEPQGMIPFKHWRAVGLGGRRQSSEGLAESARSQEGPCCLSITGLSSLWSFLNTCCVRSAVLGAGDH